MNHRIKYIDKDGDMLKNKYLLSKMNSSIIRLESSGRNYICVFLYPFMRADVIL